MSPFRPHRVPTRLVIGNLDAEHRLAGESLSRSALETASALATLLRVFARDGDRLWTPVPVDPSRLPEAPGLPRPELVSGPWDELEPADEVLAWAEVPGVEALRAARSGGTEPGGRADSGLARRLLHRSFGLGVARKLGVALPGSSWLRSTSELREHLVTGGAAASPTGGWVLKAPLSAAGRSRLVVASHPDPDEEARIRIRAENLFARHGELLFEPWMDRTADFGCTGVVGDRGEPESPLASLVPLRCHRLQVDVLGRFTGIELGPESEPEEIFREIRDIARRVAEALEAAGYRGPFGVDAYLHRDRDGREVLQPLGEINARLSFGHLARAWAERAVDGGLEGKVGLLVGRAAPDVTAWCRPLLLPRERDGSPGAWLVGASGTFGSSSPSGPNRDFPDGSP